MPRTSRSPVALGLTAVGLAVIGLSILLYATYIGVRNAHVVRYLYPTLTADALTFMVPAILLMAGLLAGAGVMLARRDAGRAGLVWLCGVGTVVVLMLFYGHVTLLRNWDFDVWIGPPEWIGALGALLTMGALVPAVINLGRPSARQAFAATDPQPHPEQAAAEAPVTEAGPPAPLRAGASRFALGGVLSIAGLIMPLVLVSGGSLDLATIVFLVVGGGGLLAGTIGAYLAAVAARDRRPAAANVARAAGVLMLLIQVWSLYQGTSLAVAGLYPEGSSDTVPLGVIMLATVVFGIGATLGGFAGLADPRSERFLLPPRGAAFQSWESWTAASPRPVHDPAPAEGYTVP